jgi:selenocysteine lyase/cysteine desulfurase
MGLSRREWLQGAVAAPIIAGTAASRAAAAAVATTPSLPDRSAFERTDLIYLDNGSQHPISRGGKAAIDAYLAKRALVPGTAKYDLEEDAPIKKFAQLINADPDEISYVQSTTAGEQMVLRSLGYPQSKKRIVTDTLHFFGSFPLYEGLAKEGVEVAWVKDRGGRIELADMDKAITPGTRLVALSLVSTFNGFQHDLKAVCDLAHSRGALVYADIIHAAGSVPVDVEASGVDFAACASYKWLMGEFGLGFLYVRKDVLPSLERTNFGYYGISEFQTHVYPLDPPGNEPADYAFYPNAAGQFMLGTHAHTVIALLNHSLDYIDRIGVPAIEAHSQELVQRFKEELPKMGYQLYSPLEARTPIATFIYADARKRLAPRLEAANIHMTVSTNRFRLTPSVYNDQDDVEKVLAFFRAAR